MTRLRELVLCAALALVALAAPAPTASADDSQIRISEIYSDGSAAKGDFIELQLMTSGQQIAGGRVLRLYNATASAFQDSGGFPAVNLPSSESQRTVLVGRDTNANADFTTSNSLFNPPLPGGAACLLQSNAVPGVAIDCLSWGNFSGSLPGGTGTPAAVLNAGQSLSRNESRGCATALDAADDTDNSAADFSLAGPSPRNNLAFPSENLCTPPPAATVVPLKKCKKKKKKKKHRSAEAAKKKGCKKKKKKKK